MPSIFVITNGPEVMGACVSKADAKRYADLNPGLNVSEVVVGGIIYWFTLPAAKRLAPPGTITEDDERDLRQAVTHSDAPVIFARIASEVGGQNRERVRRRGSRPRLKVLAGDDRPAERTPAPVRVRPPGNVRSLRDHIARSPRNRRGTPRGYMPPGSA